MREFSEMRGKVLSYLLTVYPFDSKPQFLENVVKDFLTTTYSEELVDRFLNDNVRNLQDDIIKEANRRIEEGASLRFQILDDIGEKIAGATFDQPADPRMVFQDALQNLTPDEFEALSAVILRIAGCVISWKTPQSHDQGLDSFGYAKFFMTEQAIKWLGSCPEIIFLAQAKHYKKEKVNAAEIREFVGSATLAKHAIYAVQGEKYSDLSIRPFTPLALIFVTSGEIKITAKILAQKSGIVLLASDELFQLFIQHWSNGNVKVKYTKSGFTERLRREFKGIPAAI